MALTPTERSLRGQLAANTSWANTEDRPARTARACRASLDKFEKQVDPDNTLTPPSTSTSERRSIRSLSSLPYYAIAWV